MVETVFFDLDGTLTDPKIGITTSIQYALERLGADVPAIDDLTWCIGPPLLSSLRSLVGDGHARQALSYYRERFSDVGWNENTPYPGVSETLEALADAKLRLYVATSKPLVYAQRIIEHFEMRQYFSNVFGSELDGTRSEKTDLLRFALTEVKPTTIATMVGDREHDVTGAINNGMDVIGVSYGYGSTQELENAGAHKIAGRPEDLISMLR